MRTNLNCTFAEKDDAKLLGAKWDAARKTWYIENVEDLTHFMKWIPSHRASPPTSREMFDSGVITLREYVAMNYRGGVKALTASAARAFGVPYPLQEGWHHKYSSNSIPRDAVRSIKKKVGGARKRSMKRSEQLNTSTQRI